MRLSFGCRFCAHTPWLEGRLLQIPAREDFAQLWEQPVTGTVRSIRVSKFQRRRAASPDRPHWLSREMGPLAGRWNISSGTHVEGAAGFARCLVLGLGRGPGEGGG